MPDAVDAELSSSRTDSAASEMTPRILPRSEHPISRSNFAPEALSVLQRLRQNDFRAYLVGGAVRDLYLGKSPKDYDVATDARPSKLKKLFRNCRIIGRRFRIAHVYFPSGLTVEVATFRRNSERNLRGESGILLRDNEYGSPAEDAARRDLTINGLFYDLETFSIIDYVGGVADLDNRIVRMINPPDESFREDPVRMIRALRHASRTGFSIERQTLDAIYANAASIVEANPSRLLEELLKDLRGGSSRAYFETALSTGLLDALLPPLARQLREPASEHPLWDRLAVLDRARDSDAISNPVLIATLLHTVLIADSRYWSAAGKNPPSVWGLLSQALRSFPRTIRISRRDGERVAQIIISLRKLGQCAERELDSGSDPSDAAHRDKLLPSLLHKHYIREAIELLRIAAEARGEPIWYIDHWLDRVAAVEADRSAHPGRESFPDADEDGDEAGERGGVERDGAMDDGGDGGDGEGAPKRRRRRRRRRRGKHSGE